MSSVTSLNPTQVCSWPSCQRATQSMIIRKKIDTVSLKLSVYLYLLIFDHLLKSNLPETSVVFFF